MSLNFLNPTTTCSKKCKCRLIIQLGFEQTLSKTVPSFSCKLILIIIQIDISFNYHFIFTLSNIVCFVHLTHFKRLVISAILIVTCYNIMPQRPHNE